MQRTEKIYSFYRMTSQEFFATTGGLISRRPYNRTLQVSRLYRATNEGSNGPKCGTVSEVGSSPKYSVPVRKGMNSASMTVVTDSTYIRQQKVNKKKEPKLKKKKIYICLNSKAEHEN
jgi:hypothetical protein